MNNGFGGRFVAAICVGASLNPINTSMIAIALVSIGEAFGVGVSTTAWLVTVLYIATAAGQPALGHLADRYGPRLIYLIGLALLAAGGLLGFWGAAFGMLLVARVLIGLGTAAAYPAAVAMIRQRSRRLGRAVPGGVLGSLAIATQASLAIGPVLGGLLIGAGGWRTIFLINVPLAAVGAATALAWLPRNEPTGEHSTGAALRSLRLLLANGPLMLTYLRYGLTMVSMYSFMFGWTQWLEQSAGQPVEVVGALLAPMFLVGIPVSALAARRGRVRVPLLAAAIAVVAAAFSLQLLDAETSMWGLVGVSVLFGVQNGIATVGNQAAMYAAAPPQLSGTAAGLLRMSQYLGAIFSAFLISVAFGDSASDNGLQRLSIALLVLAAVVVVLTVVRPGPATVASAQREFDTVLP